MTCLWGRWLSSASQWCWALGALKYRQRSCNKITSQLVPGKLQSTRKLLSWQCRLSQKWKNRAYLWSQKAGPAGPGNTWYPGHKQLLYLTSGQSPWQQPCDHRLTHSFYPTTNHPGGNGCRLRREREFVCNDSYTIAFCGNKQWLENQLINPKACSIPSAPQHGGRSKKMALFVIEFLLWTKHIPDIIWYDVLALHMIIIAHP